MPMLTLPGTLTTSGEVEITGPIGGRQEAYILIADQRIAWAGRKPVSEGGEMYSGQQPYTGDFSKGGYPNCLMYLFDGQSLGGSVREVSITETGLSYTFTGYMPEGSLPPVLIKGRATAAGNFQPGVTFDRWIMRAIPTSLTCSGTSRVQYRALDGNGRLYEPAGLLPYDVEITLRVDAQGEYVYLRSGSQEGKEITITLDPERLVDLVLDQTRGSLPPEGDIALVTITGGGRSATVAVSLVCDALDHFTVTASPDTIQHSESATIKVQGKDRDNRDVEPPSGTLVNVVLGTAEIYGNLQHEGQKGKTILDVPYADANSGKLTYVADGEDPIDEGPQTVVISVTKVKDERIAGAGSVVVNPSIEKFCQGKSSWAGTKYDDYVRKKKDKSGDSTDAQGNKVYHTVGSKGCALTCMAMVAKAAGADTDPGKLAEYMNDRKHYGFTADYGVKWGVVNVLEGSSQRFEPPITQGKGLQYDQGGNVALPKSTTVELPKLDQYLSKGALIIAQVYNPTTQGNHWVLLTEKQANQYKIIDPGCYEGRQDLGSYSNNVYKIVVYKWK
jgi:hypothetical protein